MERGALVYGTCPHISSWLQNLFEQNGIEVLSRNSIYYWEALMKTNEKINDMFLALISVLCRDGQACKALAVAQVAKNSNSLYLLTKRQVDTCASVCIRRGELDKAANVVMYYNTSERVKSKFVEALVSCNNDPAQSAGISTVIDSFIDWHIQNHSFEKAREIAKILGRKPLSKATEKKLCAEFLDRMF